MAEQISRYHKGYWEPISSLVVYDCVWIDRKTGEIVMRYDAADPANTSPDYGAEPDWYVLDKRGVDVQEKIAVSDCGTLVLLGGEIVEETAGDLSFAHDMWNDDEEYRRELAECDEE